MYNRTVLDRFLQGALDRVSPELAQTIILEEFYSIATVTSLFIILSLIPTFPKPTLLPKETYMVVLACLLEINTFKYQNKLVNYKYKIYLNAVNCSSCANIQMLVNVCK